MKCLWAHTQGLVHTPGVLKIRGWLIQRGDFTLKSVSRCGVILRVLRGGLILRVGSYSGVECKSFATMELTYQCFLLVNVPVVVHCCSGKRDGLYSGVELYSRVGSPGAVDTVYAPTKGKTKPIYMSGFQDTCQHVSPHH